MSVGYPLSGCLLCLLVLLSTAGQAPAQRVPSPGETHELICCGWDEVFILDVGPASDTAPKKIWSWRAKDRPELPDHMKGRFNTTDDCKPVGGGKKILITSSGGGVALVERASGTVLFYAVVVEAHSADVLPRGRVAAAGSNDGEIGGDCLKVFDLSVSEKPLCTYPLPWGHGAVWDEGRKLLWALSGEDLRSYRLKDWDSDKPALDLVAAYELPEGGGHELYPVPGTPLLSVSTARHCWVFDRDKHSFRLHPILAEAGDVKSISVNPGTGQIAYVQGETGTWWSDKIHLMRPRRLLQLPGERLYKARWNAEVR